MRHHYARPGPGSFGRLIGAGSNTGIWQESPSVALGPRSPHAKDLDDARTVIVVLQVLGVASRCTLGPPQSARGSRSRSCRASRVGIGGALFRFRRWCGRPDLNGSDHLLNAFSLACAGRARPIRTRGTVVYSARPTARAATDACKRDGIASSVRAGQRGLPCTHRQLGSDRSLFVLRGLLPRSRTRSAGRGEGVAPRA